LSIYVVDTQTFLCLARKKIKSPQHAAVLSEVSDSRRTASRIEPLESSLEDAQIGQLQAFLLLAKAALVR
jgi:hypothetical protein